MNIFLQFKKCIGMTSKNQKKYVILKGETNRLKFK